jgi:transcriptional regulator with XRE-family HTH domain
MKVITDKGSIENLATNLRRAMRLHKWSQEQLEAESGVPQATISEVLNAKIDPRVSAVLKLAQALETSVDKLLSSPAEKILTKRA